ncbi:MAG: RNA-guided endonuclease InsQ/TnpB family protein [Promethearchaeota archaeon]
MFLTVKVPLMDDRLTARKLHQLERLTARDTTIIKRYLNILEEEEENLWKQEREGQRIDRAELDRLTLTSQPLIRGKTQTPGRPIVKYDLKQEFGARISVRELKECRDTAVEMWHSYREKVKEHARTYWRIHQNPKYVDYEDELARVAHWWLTEKQPSPPCQANNYTLGKIPRRANIGTTVFIHTRTNTLTCDWLELYYFVEKGQSRSSKRLWLPLNLSSYHQNALKKGQPKTVQLVKSSKNKRWYAHITIEVVTPKVPPTDKPLAVVALDLGEKKAATAVLLTPKPKLQGEDIRFFTQPEKRRTINGLDNQIASLQRKLAEYMKHRKSTKNITRRLKKLSKTRQQLAIQYDQELTTQIVEWVQRLQHRYTVYVAVGRLKGIRASRRKGDGKSRKHRRELHRWAFARITAMLQYKLKQAGLPRERVVAVPEAWTSRTCSKCGSPNTRRPFQALLICLDCGAKIQADVNGALNIGMKLIYSLDEAALDHWLTKPLRKAKAERLRLRGARAAGRRTPCTRGSSQISRPTSGDESPAAVRCGEEPASQKVEEEEVPSSV